MVTPSAFPVFRFTTSSKRVGRSSGVRPATCRARSSSGMSAAGRDEAVERIEMAEAAGPVSP